MPISEALAQAMQAGDLERCESLVREVPGDLLASTPQGAPLLLWAVELGRLEVVRWLLDKHVPSNAGNKLGLTPLQAAIRRQWGDCVEVLLAQGADPNLRGEYGITPLHEAAARDNTEVIQRLLDSGASASLNAHANAQRTPLHWAAKAGVAQAIAILADAGAEVSALDKHGETPLHEAVKQGHGTAALALIQRGAGFSHENISGDTPLALAWKKGHLVELLLCRGAEPDPKLLEQIRSGGKGALVRLQQLQKAALAWQAQHFTEVCQELPRAEEVDLAGNWMSPEQWQKLLALVPKAPQLLRVLLGENEKRGTVAQREALAERLAMHRDLQVATAAMLNGQYEQVVALMTSTGVLYRIGDYTPHHLCAELGAIDFLPRLANHPIRANAAGMWPSELAARHRHSLLAEQLLSLESAQKVRQFVTQLPRSQGSAEGRRASQLRLLRLAKQLEAISVPDHFGMLKKAYSEQLKNVELRRAESHVSQPLVEELVLLESRLVRAPLLLVGWKKQTGRKKKPLTPKDPVFKAHQLLLVQLERLREHYREVIGVGAEALVTTLTALHQYYDAFVCSLCQGGEGDLETFVQLPVTLAGEGLGLRLLRQEAADVLCQVKKRSNRYGMHVVFPFAGMHFKLKPHAPGVEYAVDSLTKLIAGQGTTPTRLIKVIPIGDEGAARTFLASQTVAGVELREVILAGGEYLTRIDRFNFSSLVVQNLLVCPQDGKADNYMVHWPSGGAGSEDRVEIIGIDNDMAFASPFVRHRQGDEVGQHFVNVKNCLYFFPQMGEQIDPGFRRLFLAQRPSAVMARWLRGLYAKNEEYAALTAQAIFSTAECARMQLPFCFVPGRVLHIDKTLHRLHACLQARPEITLDEIFAEVSPWLYRFYQAVKAEKGDILASTEVLYRLDTPSVETRLGPHYGVERVEQALADYQELAFDFETERTQSVAAAAEQWISSFNFAEMSEIEEQQAWADCQSLYFVERLTLQGFKGSADRLSEWVQGFSGVKCLKLAGGALSFLHLQVALMVRQELKLWVDVAALPSERFAEGLSDLDLCQGEVILCLDKDVELHLAAASEDLVAQMIRSDIFSAELLSYLFDYRGVPVNQALASGSYCLHYAVERDSIVWVEYLLSKGAYINVQNAMGYSALHLAVKKQSIEMITLLCRNGIDPQLRKATQETALEMARRYSAQDPRWMSIVSVLVNYHDACTLKTVHCLAGPPPPAPVEDPDRETLEKVFELQAYKQALVPQAKRKINPEGLSMPELPRQGK